MTQTDFYNTIKYLFANFEDKFKEYVKETIVYQDVKFDAKFEKHLQTLSLQIKYYSTKFSSKLDEDLTFIWWMSMSTNKTG